MSHSRLIHTKRNFKKFQHQLLFKNCNITYWRQKSGSDARLFAVKLAILPNLDKNINKDISDLCMTLSEIIYICKSEHHQRTPQNLFRRNNLYFVFSILSKSITRVPKKMTAQNFSAATSVV